MGEIPLGNRARRSAVEDPKTEKREPVARPPLRDTDCCWIGYFAEWHCVQKSSARSPRRRNRVVVALYVPCGSWQEPHSSWFEVAPKNTKPPVFAEASVLRPATFGRASEYVIDTG